MELPVDSRHIQHIPLVMPRNVELWGLSPDVVRQARQAFQQGSLYVRLDGPTGPLAQVLNLWPNPHEAGQVVLFLSENLDSPE